MDSYSVEVDIQNLDYKINNIFIVKLRYLRKYHCIYESNWSFGFFHETIALR